MKAPLKSTLIFAASAPKSQADVLTPETEAQKWRHTQEKR